MRLYEKFITLRSTLANFLETWKYFIYWYIVSKIKILRNNNVLQDTIKIVEMNMALKSSYIENSSFLHNIPENEPTEKWYLKKIDYLNITRSPRGRRINIRIFLILHCFICANKILSRNIVSIVLHGVWKQK